LDFGKVQRHPDISHPPTQCAPNLTPQAQVLLYFVLFPDIKTVFFFNVE
jgi:hypothetical protein